MKRVLIITLFLILSFYVVFPQSVTLKVREKTILRGERYVTVKFSVEGGKENFTDVDVAKGGYYYFVCLPEGNWKIDEEFAQEFTSKVLIRQDGNVYYPEVYDLL